MIALFGTVLLIAIDYVLQFIYKRAGVLLARVLRKKSGKTEDGDVEIFADDEEGSPLGDSPFEDFHSDCDSLQAEKSDKGDNVDTDDNSQNEHENEDL